MKLYFSGTLLQQTSTTPVDPLEARANGVKTSSISPTTPVSAKLNGDASTFNDDFGKPIQIQVDGVDSGVTITPAQIAAGDPINISDLASTSGPVTIRLRLGSKFSQDVTVSAKASGSWVIDVGNWTDAGVWIDSSYWIEEATETPTVAPTLNSSIPDVVTTTQTNGTYTVNLSDYFTGDQIIYNASGTGVISVGPTSGVLVLDKGAVASAATISVTADNGAGNPVNTSFQYTVNAVAPYAYPASVLLAAVNRQSSVSTDQWLNEVGGDPITITGTTMSPDTDGVRAVLLDGNDDFMTLPESIFAGASDAATGTQAGRFNLAITLDLRFNGGRDVVLGAADGKFGVVIQDTTATGHGWLADPANLNGRVAFGRTTDNGTLTDVDDRIRPDYYIRDVYRHSITAANIDQHMTFIFRGMKLETIAGIVKYIGTNGTDFLRADVSAVHVWSSTGGMTTASADEKEIVKIHHHARLGQLVDASDSNPGFGVVPKWMSTPYAVPPNTQILSGDTLTVDPDYYALKYQPSDGDVQYKIEWFYQDDPTTIVGVGDSYTIPPKLEGETTSANYGRTLEVNGVAYNEHGSTGKSKQIFDPVEDVKTISQIIVHTSDDIAYFAKGDDSATTSISFRHDMWGFPIRTESLEFKRASVGSVPATMTLKMLVDPSSSYTVDMRVTGRTDTNADISYGLGDDVDRFLNTGGVAGTVPGAGNPYVDISHTITTTASQTELVVTLFLPQTAVDSYIQLTNIYITSNDPGVAAPTFVTPV